MPEEKLEEQKKCTCDFCKLSKRMDTIIAKKDPDEMASLITELANLLASTDFDKDYYSCILDGSWPQAEEILTHSLGKAKYHQNREVDSLNRAGEYSNTTYICPICKRDLGSAMRILGDKAGVLAIHNKMHMTEIELLIWITLGIHKKELPEELQQMVDERNETRWKLFGVGKNG